MTEIVMTLPVMSALGFLAMTLFFWIRGVRRCSRTDLVLSLLLLFISCLVLIGTAISCEVFSEIGLMLIGFGIASLVLSRKAEETNTVIQKSSLRAIGVGCCILGFLMQMHA